MRFANLAVAVSLAASVAMAADTTISAGKLAKDAKDYYGQTVTVKAEVEDVFDTNTFTLDEDAILAGADVLVLVPGGVKGKLAHDQKVTVTGKVRPFVTAELDRDFDFFKGGKIIRTQKKVDFETRPVLVATSVTTEAGMDLMASK